LGAVAACWCQSGTQTSVATHRRVMRHHGKGSRQRRGFPTQANGLWSVQATPIIDYPYNVTLVYRPNLPT